MNDETLRALGKLVEGEPPRDAVHIAVIPVVAGEQLAPGVPVVLENGKALLAAGRDRVGVVDPFLTDYLKPGQRFWLFLNPGSITSLRHEWTHPAFPVGQIPSEQRTASEVWLRRFAEEYRISYHDLVGGAESGDGACFGTSTPSDEIRSADFWRHVENVTGKQFDDSHRENTFFHCAC